MGLGDLLEYRLEAFLKLASELCSGDERAQIERHDTFIFEAVGHVARHNSASQAFNNRGFAHAWLADQGGVVLGAT